jgi:hypothetical protein
MGFRQDDLQALGSIGVGRGHRLPPISLSASCAICNQCSAILSQRSLSSGLSALSACWRHSSAFRRNSSARVIVRAPPQLRIAEKT